MVCISSIGVQAQHEVQVGVIAFYNFENLFDTEDDPKNWGDNEFLADGLYNYTQEVYEQKLHNIATVLKDMAAEYTPDGPAVIGTAEVENSRVLTDLIKQPEIEGRYQFVHFDSRDRRGIDVALLYNPKYFKVISARSLKVDISKADRGKRTRDILFCSGIFAGDTLHFLINHWPSRRGGEAATAAFRHIAAAVCKKIADSLSASNPASKIIIMGDLNDDPVNTSITEVLKAKSGKKNLNPADLYNPWNRFYKKGYGTLSWDDRWNLFDQIIITGSFMKYHSKQWIYYKSEVFKKDYLLEKFGRYKGYPKRSFSNNQWNNGYSDHLPTMIYLVKEAD